jgi:hypothetical protein
VVSIMKRCVLAYPPLKVVVSLELMPRWPGISGWNGSDSDLRGSRMISELLIRDVRRS